ncbi:MAG: hypothetical protein NTY81_00865 [Candidatus Staskawiczbacteria bacterium]|nr:hypothetical protein [Candidatus Staskawiczbacteria bacterium]
MKDRMSVEQLGEILMMLFKAFIKMSVEVVTGKMDWDVSCATAQQIVNDSQDDFFGRFLQFLAKGGRVGGILMKIATASVDGAKKFIAKDHLAEANVGWTNDVFKEQFLNLVEENVPDATLAIHRLELDSKDPQIIAELGDLARAYLAYLFCLIKKQAHGEEGKLLVNGRANVMHISGKDGNVWAVIANWNSVNRYWSVHAYSVENPDVWFAGSQVLSCDS